VDDFDWENLDEELHKCHKALMKVWNLYRDQMHRRGFDTVDVFQELALKVLANRERFRGTTQGEFCAWSRQIVRNFILAELRRRRGAQMDPDLDPVDTDQQRPSSAFQDEIRHAVYELASASLPEHERVLIELRFESGHSVREVGERLRNDYDQLWQIHRASWSPEHALKQACERAKEAINRSAVEIHRLLEGGSASG
jgi:RNA polymerase sigma factor (sigma-70 family)